MQVHAKVRRAALGEWRVLPPADDDEGDDDDDEGSARGRDMKVEREKEKQQAASSKQHSKAEEGKGETTRMGEGANSSPVLPKYLIKERRKEEGRVCDWRRLLQEGPRPTTADYTVYTKMCRTESFHS